MKLLMIDNYDSFTYNLVQYLMELGAHLDVRRNDVVTPEDILGSLQPNAIIISPGPGRPENAGNCLDIIAACHGQIPILGVCLGHQAIGRHFGGAVTYAPTLMHGKVSDIYHKGHRLFSGIDKIFSATRYHSLMLQRANLPKELTIIAETKDKLIMAVAHATQHTYGIQFHPESIMTPQGKTILKNFLAIVEHTQPRTR